MKSSWCGGGRTYVSGMGYYKTWDQLEACRETFNEENEGMTLEAWPGVEASEWTWNDEVGWYVLFLNDWTWDSYYLYKKRESDWQMENMNINGDDYPIPYPDLGPWDQEYDNIVFY